MRCHAKDGSEGVSIVTLYKRGKRIAKRVATVFISCPRTTALKKARTGLSEKAGLPERCWLIRVLVEKQLLFGLRPGAIA